MKTNYITAVKTLFISISILCFSSCNDFLDITPPSEVTDVDYLKSEEQLAAYVIKYYADYSDYNKNSDDKGGMLPSMKGSGGNSPLKDDINTDNEVGKNSFSDIFLAGKDGAKKVGQTGGKWNFSNIYKWNYFINTVEPRIEAGEVKGLTQNINHYLGEAYFLRALEYFYRLQKLGDFPIIKEVLANEQAPLVEASKRQPRNEVARFILEDLEKAISLLLETAPQGGKTRISRDAAYLLKARVALFEGTWLKYHAGTALVPNGPGWPGKDKEHNANYTFPTGSIEAESNFFLEQAMNAAKVVAEKRTLAENNKEVILDAAGTGYDKNPYYDMFTAPDPSNYSEVIMCRLYKKTVMQHWFNHFIQNGGGNFGYTKGMEKAFLTQNGLPYYAPGSLYADDNSINDTKQNRDYRWQLFMKAPGERAFTNATLTFSNPSNIYSNDGKKASSTGYIHGKGFTLDMGNAVTSLGEDITPYIIYRAAEAYLTYIEADYVKNGSLDAFSDKYWKALRSRAGVDTDYAKTIAATDMSKEAETDWAAYSKGQLIDATLYNIRRERRCEFIGEGRRLDDLFRWRALDQLNGERIYGSKVPDRSVYDYIDNGNTKNYLDNAVVLNSEGYIDILQASSYKNGLFFTEAHYLDPINVQHFLISSVDGKSVETSPIYQNPGWPIENGGTAAVN